MSFTDFFSKNFEFSKLRMIFVKSVFFKILDFKILLNKFQNFKIPKLQKGHARFQPKPQLCPKFQLSIS
jgi:hypothetical protein